MFKMGAVLNQKKEKQKYCGIFKTNRNISTWAFMDQKDCNLKHHTEINLLILKVPQFVATFLLDML